jgi:hypothetical protein
VFRNGKNDIKEPGGNTGLAKTHDENTEEKNQIGPTITALVIK